jgi:hypothetical protein
MPMTDDEIAQDVTLLRTAFDDITDELQRFIKESKKPRSAGDLVNSAAQFKALANRWDALVRATIDLQGRVCI